MPLDRSEVMSRVRSVDTTPELVVRHLAHSMGYRFRLHRRDLPGSPDMVFAGLGKVVFVHGCFWHQHRCKRGSRQPKTNRIYWIQKLQRNVERDKRVRRKLRRLGWDVFVVWECQTKPSRREWLEERLINFLER